MHWIQKMKQEKRRVQDLNNSLEFPWEAMQHNSRNMEFMTQNQLDNNCKKHFLKPFIRIFRKWPTKESINGTSLDASKEYRIAFEKDNKPISQKGKVYFAKNGDF